MQTKKVILILFLILLVFAAYIFSPRCDYKNWAWGGPIKECTCLGLKIDTSLPPRVMDAPATSKCVGIVKEYKCYDYKNLSPISCP